MVDIDLETVIRFCENFEKQYLEVLHENANKLRTAAGSASATLGSTGMATKSSAELEAVALAISRATAAGEERIRELKRKAQTELDDVQRIESMLR